MASSPLLSSSAPPAEEVEGVGGGQYNDDKDQGEEEMASLTIGLDDDSSNEERGALIDRKRQRQLRKKPGWYRRRSQYMTKGAKKKLQQLGHIFCLEAPPYGVPLNVPEIFNNMAGSDRVILEVGFGHGDCLVELGRRFLGQAVIIGSEWHKASIGHAVQRLNETKLNEKSNVSIFKGDFMNQIRAGWYGKESLDEVCVFFPDPWPHEADKPRRVINSEMVGLIWGALKPGGFLHVATDVHHYAVWVSETLAKASAEKDGGWIACPDPEEESILVNSMSMVGEIEEGSNVSIKCPESAVLHVHDEEQMKKIYGLLRQRPRWRPCTHYEQRGIEVLCNQIYDLRYRKIVKRGSR